MPLSKAVLKPLFPTVTRLLTRSAGMEDSRSDVAARALVAPGQMLSLIGRSWLSFFCDLSGATRGSSPAAQLKSFHEINALWAVNISNSTLCR